MASAPRIPEFCSPLDEWREVPSVRPEYRKEGKGAEGVCNETTEPWTPQIQKKTHVCFALKLRPWRLSKAATVKSQSDEVDVLFEQKIFF